MTGTDKWPRELDAAIREEIVRGKLRPVQVWEKVCAGTLDGLDPTPIPKRTFYYRWTREARALARAEQQQAEFPRLIHPIALRLGAAGSPLRPARGRSANPPRRFPRPPTLARSRDATRPRDQARPGRRRDRRRSRPPRHAERSPRSPLTSPTPQSPVDLRASASGEAGPRPRCRRYATRPACRYATRLPAKSAARRGRRCRRRDRGCER